MNINSRQSIPGLPVLRLVLKLFFRGLGVLVMAGLAIWSIMAVYYSNLPAGWLRSCGAVVYALLLAAILWRVHPWWLARLVWLGALALVILWFLLTPPSNDRDWQPDVAVLPSAEVMGDRVTIHNIRNCDYRSETNYIVRHYDKNFDLAKLRSVDLYLVYWGSPMIAHTMLSFGFGGGDYVCFSIETRKEQGEAYSAIKGFFRQFELTYVIGDERDLVRVRTNFRGEQVYLYRLSATPALARLVFLDYLKEVNRLKDRPEWYNALTSNCTTNIRGHTKPYAQNSRFDWRILLNGQIDQMAYERRTLDQSLPFLELKARSLINSRAKAADGDAAFSTRIREGLPGFASVGMPTPDAVNWLPTPGRNSYIRVANVENLKRLNLGDQIVVNLHRSPGCPVAKNSTAGERGLGSLPLPNADNWPPITDYCFMDKMPLATRHLSRATGALAVSLIAALTTGRSGINASKSVSPLDFLLPGLHGQNRTPLPEVPTEANSAPLLAQASPVPF